MNQTQLSSLINLLHKSQLIPLTETEKTEALKTLPDAMRPSTKEWLHMQQHPEIAAAWHSIYSGEWGLALKFLDRIDIQLEPLATLAYARIATRNGAHTLAAKYLSYAIYRFRELHQDHNLARAHGVLGELLLRQGLNKKALQHMQIAYNLTPLGHHSRQRQYSYLAMPLARLGQIGLANEHYMRAFFMAINELDQQGTQHALVRSAALSLFGDRQAIQQSKRLQRHYSVEFTGVVKGYWSILCFLEEWKKGAFNQPYLNQALKAFEKKAPLELMYITAINPNQCTPVTIKELAPLTQCHVPESPDLMALHSLPIHNIKSCNAIQTPEQLERVLTQFFI